MASDQGYTVVDVYQGWCGPCKAVVNLFRKIRNEFGDDLLRFAVAEVDSVDALEKYRGKCEPTFLFYAFLYFFRQFNESPSCVGVLFLWLCKQCHSQPKHRKWKGMICLLPVERVVLQINRMSQLKHLPQVVWK
uniref:Thioredoxin domain-containing protein n=1 Tax=Podarcis muralis TaxID=64176 RepID=A0A670JC35_PODMU